MTLELHIAGPGLDVRRVLRPGGPHLVLGRDADCGVPLPDLQRNVSRRHLAVWNEADELHFHVLSVVNGVEMPFGEAPPGAKGVLAYGQRLKLAEYSLEVSLMADAAGQESDPWAVFGREGSDASSAAGAPAQHAPEDDPFGDWGFGTTFGSGSKDGGPLDAAALAETSDLSAFFTGLGLDAARMGPLNQGELEMVGKLVRAAMLGLFELQRGSCYTVRNPQELEELESTLPARQSNPLKTGWPPEAKLRYLFGGYAVSGGFVRPELALRELLVELLAHDRAVDEAARQAVQATLQEFSPAALKARLLGSGTGLFESARAWNAYAKYYAEQARELPAWAQRLVDRHFAEAYLRESLRIKRDTAQPPA